MLVDLAAWIILESIEIMMKYGAAKDWAFDRIKPIISFFIRHIYKTSPGQLRWVCDPLTALAKRYDDALQQIGVSAAKTKEFYSFSDDVSVMGWWKFEDIGVGGHVTLEQGQSVIVVSKSRRGFDFTTDEGSCKFFSYVQIVTPQGLMWVEEFNLSSRPNEN